MEAQKVCASYIKPDSYSMVDYVFNILSETPNFGQSWSILAKRNNPVLKHINVKYNIWS